MILHRHNKLRKGLIILVFALILGLPLSLFVLQNLDKTNLDEVLLFKLFGKTFLSDIYVWYPDGRVKNISPSNEGIYYMASIHPDGTSAVFFGGDAGNSMIWKVPLPNGQAYALTSNQYSARYPAFSWDGSRIAFSAGIGREQEIEQIELMHGDGQPPEDLILNIFVMNEDGSNIKQITFGDYQDQRPTFSPDGKTIVFVSNRKSQFSKIKTKYRLWSVPADGSEAPKEFRHDGWAYRPWFSRNGKSIYFFTAINGRHQICNMSLEDGKISPLENDDMGNSHGPFIDQSKNVLLMHSTRDHSNLFKIYELPLNGKAPKLLMPEGFETALHATRSKNGLIVFDVPEQKWIRKLGSNILELSESFCNFLF